MPMNAPTGKLTGISDIDVELSSFYRLRSEMLDGFAEIEASILVYLSTNNLKNICETAPLGHKVAAAMKIPAGPQRSKELKTKADTELAQLKTLLELRADMVHSRMEIAVTIHDKLIAIFKNAKTAAHDDHGASVFDLSELSKFVALIQARCHSLNTALTARNPATVPKPKVAKA
jgi:predicted ATP-binding protein involved in virulence